MLKRSHEHWAVVGGGAAGLSAAFGLRARGADVTLFDADDFGRGALWAAAGMITPSFEPHSGPLGAAMDAALRASLSRWPTFAAELHDASHVDVGLRLHGVLGLLEDSRSGAIRVDDHQLRGLEPGLGPSACAGNDWAFAEGEGDVDNRRLAHALITALSRFETELRPRECVTGLNLRGGRVVRLHTAMGREQAVDGVVWATGAAPIALDGFAAPPIRPVKGQAMAFAPTAAGPRHVVRAGVYVAPKADGRIILGATSEPGRSDVSVDAGALAHLHAGAGALFPALENVQPIERWAGLRPATPDLAPAIGPGEVENLIWALGGYRSGVALSPLIAAYFQGDAEARRLLSVFVPGRFFAEIGKDHGVSATSQSS